MLFGGVLRILSVGSISPRTNLLVFFGWTNAIAVPLGRDCLHSLSVGVEEEGPRPTFHDTGWKLSLMMDGT